MATSGRHRRTRRRGPTRLVGRATLLILVMLLTVVAGCTSGGGNHSGTDQPTGTGPAVTGTFPTSTANATPSGWTIVNPPGMLPASLATGPGGVLVGGASDGPDQHPLFAVQRAGEWQDVPATSTTAYGGMGSIVQVGMSQDGSIVGIGNVSGGAHLNPRWSAWIGTTSGLDEEPQTVETFGGPDAEGITGVLITDMPTGPVPLVVGMWGVAPGVTGIATWQHDSALKPSTWVRQPSHSVLAGTEQRLVSATAAAATDPGVMISGLETVLGGPQVHQHAVVWTSPDAVSWIRIDLDTSDLDSAATDLACAGGSCVVVGRLGEHLAAWQVTGTMVNPMAGLPDRAIDRYAGRPRVATDGSSVAIAVGAGADLLSRSAAGQWVSSGMPAGDARQLALSGGRLYLLLRPVDGRDVLYSTSG